MVGIGSHHLEIIVLAAIVEADPQAEAVGQRELLLDRLSGRFPEIRRALESEDSLFNVAINEQMYVEGIRKLPLKSGDRVELIQAFSGG